MTEKEAIKILEMFLHKQCDLERVIPVYDANDIWLAVKMASQTLEKQIPKEPYYYGDGYWNGELVYDTWTCPNCSKSYEVDFDNYGYCPNCGQAIDFGKEEE